MGECSYTLTPTDSAVRHASKHTCARTHIPGGPISLVHLKPAYLLENQLLSAPGPINKRHLEQTPEI